MAFDCGNPDFSRWRFNCRLAGVAVPVMHNPLETFGKRSVPRCGDCDSDGDCTMNCSPAKKPETVYSYTGTEDGDFVIWKGDAFVANVGGAALAEVGKQQIAFDVDKAHAELIVNALNNAATIDRLTRELVEARASADYLAERCAMLEKHSSHNSGLSEEFREAQVKAEAERDAARAELAAAREEAQQHKADADMYANAWQREIGPPYAAKRHHIDAMVLTTRQVREQANRVPGLLKRIAELERAEETKRLDAEYGQRALKGPSNG